MGLMKAASCFMFFFAIILDSYVAPATSLDQTYLSDQAATAPPPVARPPPPPPPGARAPPPVALAPKAPIFGFQCVAKCRDRCESRPIARRLVCNELCVRCCFRSLCVPPGPAGSNTDQCKNWDFTLYRGLPFGCP